MPLNAPQQAAYNSLLQSSGQKRADAYAASMQPAPAAALPLYQSLTSTSTPDQIAAAYKEFADGAGGDTQANQSAAINYLNNLGVGAPVINQAYGQYTQASAAPTAATVTAPKQQVPAYFAANPDVAAEYAKNSQGMTPEQFAATHYQKFGAAEQRAAPIDIYERMVKDAYGSIGRTGIGTEASNIDQAGFDNWVNALKTGGVKASDLTNTFKGSVADYLVANPDDKYSAYVTNYLQENKNPEIAGVQQLYQEVLGRDADAGGLGSWYKQFGTEISPEERALFEKSAQGELSTRVKDLYTDFLGRTADDEGLEYWKKQFGSSIDDAEREAFRASAAAEINKQFGVTTPAAEPTKEGILSGFKYIKDSGIDESKLKNTLGEDVFNTYKSGFSDYAKTGIANILSDGKLSFDEASTAVKFGRDYGYDSQKLADLTGQKKELFDTINKSYDDTTNKIVDSVLGAEDAKTDGDKIARALALQQKYGFTDEDLAKATDFTPAQVKEYLDPTRNFSKTFQEKLSKPDLSGKELLSFLEDSKSNQGIGKAYGSNIDAQITRLNELNDKWKGYKVDGYQAENIYNQVNGITKAANGQNWSGSWMGGGENAAKEATALLMRKGVDNLSDLGVEKNYEKTPVDQEFYNGQRVYQTDDGKKYVVKALPSSGDSTDTVADFLPPDAKTIPGKVVIDPGVWSGDGGGATYTFQPLTGDELKTYDPKTGKFDKDIGSKLIDKSTGKVVSTSESGNNFILDSYETGNFFKSKDKTMGIMMTDQGVPVPYQTTEKGGLVYSPVFPIMLSMLAPGVGSAISGALPGAGVAAAGAAEGAFTAAVAPTLTNTALTQGILGGGMAALTGQDVLKGAILGGVGAPISAGIGSLLPAGMDPAAARAITSAGTGVAKGVLQGGDFEDLLGQGVLSGLTNYGLGEATKGLNLTPQQLNLATGIALPLLQGKDINPIKLAGSLAQATR